MNGHGHSQLRLDRRHALQTARIRSSTPGLQEGHLLSKTLRGCQRNPLVILQGSGRSASW